jgi:pyruvate dehydrogenase E1 component beta subunit
MAVITYRQALNDTLAEELARDPNVYLMGEEIGKFEGSYKITAGLLQKFGPKRVVDTPIAEMGFVGMAAGSAMLGLRPVVEIMTINFILMAVDQVVNHASKIHYMFGGQSKVPMVIRTPSGGVGQLAATHSQSFENWFAYCPGMKVVAPSTPYDAKGLLRASIRDDDPVVFIESLPLYDTKGEVPENDDFTVPIGMAEVKKEGTDITVVAYSRMT